MRSGNARKPPAPFYLCAIVSNPRERRRTGRAADADLAISDLARWQKPDFRGLLADRMAIGSLTDQRDQ
jgi:hypothetical protein